MSLLKKKKKISSIAMMHLIFETCKYEISSISEILNNLGCLYDKEKAEVNCVVLNYELYRFELYKSNKKEDVDYVLGKVYDSFFYTISSNKKEIYKIIVDEMIKKIEEIFSQKKLLAPKENFVYRLLLEQLEIKESSIKSIYVQNLIYLAKKWVVSAENINNIYIIDDNSEEMKKNQSIDFRF